jgi:CheY-like chemotaxis protein
MTVLVVDDEPSYRSLVRELLMGDGFDVLTAENGDEALRKLSVVQPDIIISDVYMPIMDGTKLHRSVRAMPRYERLPFLFMSAYNDEYAMGSVCDPRYDGFFKKGRPAKELEEWIKYLTTPEDKRDKLLPGQPARMS